MPITSLGFGEQSFEADELSDYSDIKITALANGNYAATYTRHNHQNNNNYVSVLSVFTPDGQMIDSSQGWQDGNHTTFAALPDGRMAVAFLSESDGVDYITIGTYATPTGMSVPIPIMDTDPGTMLIAGAPDGRILILGLNGDKVVGQYLGADGVTLGSPFSVYEPAGADGITQLSDLKVTTLSDGSFFIGWNEVHDTTATYATTTILADGSIDAPTEGPTQEGLPIRLDGIIGLRDGGTAYVSEYLGGGNHEIDLTIDGHSVTVVPQSSVVADQASVAELADGRFVVTWHLFDPSFATDNDGAIMAQIFNRDGSADGDAFAVEQNFFGDEREPTVIALPDGHFVISWHTDAAAGNTSADGPTHRTYDPLQFKSYSVVGETWHGGELEDIIQGGDGADHLYGEGGNDAVSGFGGIDVLSGGTGRDTVLGGDGDDTLVIDNGDDVAGETYNGGAGEDTLQIGAKDASWSVDLRDDSVAQIEHITLGDSTITAGAGVLHINASQLTGLDITDKSGAAFKTTLDISMGSQHQFFANAGALIGLNDAGDTIMVEGTKGADTIFGNGYNEKLFGLGGNDSIVGGGGNDSLDGGDSDDSIMAGSGQDTLRGGNGNDTLQGGGGKDTVDGGAGSHDRADYSYAAVKVSVTLSAGKATVKLSSTDIDKLAGIEDLAGGTKGDALKGDTHANALMGQGGHDTLTGGTGNDHFVFASNLAADSDTITDFSHGHDKIDLVKAAFDGLSSGPHLTSAEFYAHAGATHAHDLSDRIVYDTAHGKLYYDHDGSGGDAAVLIATLSNHSTLSASDFNII